MKVSTPFYVIFTLSLGDVDSTLLKYVYNITGRLNVMKVERPVSMDRREGGSNGTIKSKKGFYY